MKVLLDENLPHKLRAYLVQHETATLNPGAFRWVS